MQELKIVYKKKETIHRAPAAFDEMTREQFILTAENILRSAIGSHDSDWYFCKMLGIDEKIWKKLPSFYCYSIRGLFEYTGETEPPITKQLLPYIEINGQKYIGYQPGFSNTTWQEFIYADQYILQRKYREAAACLYRPQRANYDGETDRRIPFTIYGVNNRLEFFKDIPEAEIFAFVLNYNALRKRNLEEKYPFVFGFRKEKEEEEEKKGSAPGTFSWVAIHREMMGDNFYDESKYFELGVQVVLHRLNSAIKENKSKKK